MSYKYICPLDVFWYKMLLNKSSQKSILFLKKFTTNKSYSFTKKANFFKVKPDFVTMNLWDAKKNSPLKNQM